MAEIPVIFAVVCAILMIGFVLITFFEDSRRKKRKKNRREAEKALAKQGDLGPEKGSYKEVESYDEEELYGEFELYGEEFGEDNMVEGASGEAECDSEQDTSDKEKRDLEQVNLFEESIEDRIEDTNQESKEKPVINVCDVTMKFRIATGNTSGLKDFLIQKLKKQISTRELVALDHISFEVFKGEVVGIIGTNGSGKSTLLKIVSGALSPSEGEVIVDRRKVQMLSLGAGFDTELSAKENVYLNGAIIGYSKEFINQNYDKIVEFSELDGFMDEKVKNFSSGMTSRLAFSIATVGDAAEILILDEVLSVGDEFFRKKSLARVKEMIHGGSTVLMVSHGMGTILDNCTKVVWIEKGKLQMVGDARTVCAAYRNQFK